MQPLRDKMIAHPFCVTLVRVAAERASLLYVLVIDCMIALLELLMIHLLAKTSTNRCVILS